MKNENYERIEKIVKPAPTKLVRFINKEEGTSKLVPLNRKQRRRMKI